MAADIVLITAIHRIETELADSVKGVKALAEQRSNLINDMDEYRALQDALTAVKAARVNLRLAIQDNRELNKLEVDISEAKFKKRDLGEILSHHLVVYTQDTGRDVVRDRDGLTRQIELKAKEGKPTLDQPRLPLGINRHLGERQPISDAKPEVRRIEVGEVAK
jgi:hypothetical protein